MGLLVEFNLRILVCFIRNHTMRASLLRSMAGKLPIKTSPHVEAWNANREAYEQTFQWTPGNLAGTVVFCVAIPTGIYQLIKAEFVRGYPLLCLVITTCGGSR